MFHELNIAKEETREDSAETFSGEDKGVMDESKIVPIVNKTNPAESGSSAATAETAAQLVAQYAAQPADPAVGQPAGAGQTAGQAGPQTAGQTGLRPDFSAGSGVQTGQKDFSAGSGITAGQTSSQTDFSTGSGIQAGQTSSGNPAANTGSNTAADYSASPDPGYTAAEAPSKRSKKRRSFRYEPDDDFDFDEDERPKKRFFRFRSHSDEESRDKMILSRIKDEDLMEYLALEQRRLEFMQQAKEAKEKRILIAFQLLISLAAIVGITYLLQDNPTILISILYIVGIVAALNVWKNPHDKGWGKR